MKKYFVKLTSRLRQRSIHQVMWYFWVFIMNLFFLLWSILISQENCVYFDVLVSLNTELISLDTSCKPKVGFFLKITSKILPSWIILSISFDELNSINWLLKGWIFLKFYFIAVKIFDVANNIRGFLETSFEYYFLSIIVKANFFSDFKF